MPSSSIRTTPSPSTIAAMPTTPKANTTAPSRTYDQAIKLNPNNTLRLHRSRHCLRRKRATTTAPSRTYDQAIKLDPNHALAFYNRGAVPTTPKANTTAPSRNSTAPSSSIRTTPTPSPPRGIAYDEKGPIRPRWSRTTTRPSAQSELTPTPSISRGIAYNEQRPTRPRHPGLRDSRHQAQSDHPSLPSTVAAFAYDEKGQYDRAIQDFDQANKLNPNNTNAINARGKAYNAKGQHDRAIQDYDQAIKLDPNYAPAFPQSRHCLRRKRPITTAPFQTKTTRPSSSIRTTPAPSTIAPPLSQS